MKKAFKIISTILSVWVPIVGLLYWFLLRNDDEKQAKYYLKLAGLGLIINIAIYVIKTITQSV